MSRSVSHPSSPAGGPNAKRAMATTTCMASPEDILACQFDRWFPHFQEHTMKSRVIPLQENFVAYLLEDGVILPAVPDGGKFGTDELSDDEGVVEHIDDDDAAAAVVDDFHELTAQIVRGIADLKGEVFVKLNWSAPLDASWLKGGSMKCTSSSDVYLLLKSSDRVAFDIEHMFDLCTTAATSSSSSSVSSSGSRSSGSSNSVRRPDAYHLVLRKWANLNPAMEFRLFCAADAILGLCQRDLSTYYEFLANEADDLEDLIVEFWETKIRGKFGLTKCKTLGTLAKQRPFVAGAGMCTIVVSQLRSRAQTLSTCTWTNVGGCGSWISTLLGSRRRRCSSTGTSCLLCAIKPALERRRQRRRWRRGRLRCNQLPVPVPVPVRDCVPRAACFLSASSSGKKTRCRALPAPRAGPST